MKSLQNIILLLLTLTPLLGYCQIGPVNIIDSSFESAAASNFVIADIDNDGDNELITSFAGSAGRLAYYNNLSNSTFSDVVLIESLPFCRGVATGDFDGNNTPDLIAIGGIDAEARIYLNDNGTLSSGSILDSEISIQVNDVVVADFDANNSDDIVIIGQHSIDLYRNNGNGDFTKEVILSTSTSPVSLECLDLATADVDNDGDIDLICGETEGLVIYINDGNGIFSPNYYSVIPEILFLVHPFDADSDGDMDVVARSNSGDVKWFSNNGSGIMTFEAILSNIPNLVSLSSIDYNNDGHEDIYASYMNNISIFENDSDQSFENEISVHQDNGLIMGVVQIADLNSDQGKDFIWCGGNNTIAYHLNETPLSVTPNELSLSYQFFPNPTTGMLNSNKPFETITVYDAYGTKLFEAQNLKMISLTPYPAGMYFLCLSYVEHFGFQKIVKR